MPDRPEQRLSQSVVSVPGPFGTSRPKFPWPLSWWQSKPMGLVHTSLGCDHKLLSLAAKDVLWLSVSSLGLVVYRGKTETL